MGSDTSLVDRSLEEPITIDHAAYVVPWNAYLKGPVVHQTLEPPSNPFRAELTAIPRKPEMNRLE